MNPIAVPVPTSESAAATATPSAGLMHPREIKTFVRRAGRTTTAQARAYEQFGARYLRDYTSTPIALHSLFPHQADAAARKIVLEIGFGMGETTAHIAALLPQTNFIACEVHEPGVGALLKRAGEMGLDNLAIFAHDAVQIVKTMLPPDSLDGIHIFFPDPWHKKRHHKRRLVQGPLIAELASRLKAGGYMHLATDWQPYAEQMLQVLSAEPQLRNTATSAEGYAEKPHYRRLTKFENRGLKLGHGVWDLVFAKR